MSDNRKRNRKQDWKPSFPYNVDYNDHFETPLQAYQDLQPLISWVTNSDSSSVVLYDPYYCDGQTKKLLHTLGYENVVHEKRDFYLDIQNDSVPDFSFLLTNPPYSEEHKKKCLDYAFGRLKQEDKPFSLLLPAYVATKSYFRQLLETHGLTNDAMVYLVPNTDYAYDHPEGTGKDESPFRSMWFCGLPRGRYALVREFWKTSKSTHQQQQANLYLSLAELEDALVISSQHRPNPKQRKKKRKMIDKQQQKEQPQQQQQQQQRQEKQQQLATGGNTPNPQSSEDRNNKSTQSSVGKKKSKYRDDSGTRKRRRF